MAPGRHRPMGTCAQMSKTWQWERLDVEGEGCRVMDPAAMVMMFVLFAL